MNKNEYLMQHDCLAGDENKIWYIASRYSYLVEIDRVTGEARGVFSLKKEGKYRSLIKDGNRLLLIPAEKGKLWIYDITDGKTMSSVIPDKMFEEGSNWSAKYIQLGQYIYFSWESPVIVRYDLLSGQWKLLTKWRRLIPKDNQYKNWFQNEAFFNHGFLYFPIGTSRMLLKLNPDNNEFEVLNLRIEKRVVNIENTSFLNNELWMECKNNDGTTSIYCCRNWKSCQCEKVSDLDKKIVGESGIRMFSVIEKIGNKLLLLPGSCDKVYLINLKSKMVSLSNQYPTVSRDKLNPDWFSAFNYYKGLRMDGKFIVIHPWTYQLIEINEDTDDVKKLSVVFSDKTRNKIEKDELDSSTIYYEGVFTFKDFLRAVVISE